METAEGKRRILSVVGRPRGKAGRGRQTANTARSEEATNALVATKRASAAPDEVPVWSRVVFASPTYQRSIFSAFQFIDAIFSTALAYDDLGDSAASPE